MARKKQTEAPVSARPSVKVRYPAHVELRAEVVGICGKHLTDVLTMTLEDGHCRIRSADGSGFTYLTIEPALMQKWCRAVLDELQRP